MTGIVLDAVKYYYKAPYGMYYKSIVIIGSTIRYTVGHST